MKKCSFGLQNLEDLVALHPHSRQAKFTLKAITRFARQLLHVIKGDEIACLRDEWKALQGEAILSNWYETGKFFFTCLCFLFLKKNIRNFQKTVNFSCDNILSENFLFYHKA